MKKIVALALVVMMLLASCSFVLAEEPKEGYPEVVEGIDFGLSKKHWC
ncbi:MAG: hypothetical protein IJ662_07085 [Clostridia bacterium]|nr:hypothetical protein [Clostridia bacterium]